MNSPSRSSRLFALTAVYFAPACRIAACGGGTSPTEKTGLHSSCDPLHQIAPLPPLAPAPSARG